MTEKEKAKNGYLYNSSGEELLHERMICKDICYDFNACKPSDTKGQEKLIKKLFGAVKGNFQITAPFWCDYGYNIKIGNNFYANHNLVILDCAEINFGDNVLIGPNCCISAAGHATDPNQRNEGLEIALPINVGNSVWIGAGATLLPGVTIGNNVIIGAGSVVNKDIPSDCIAVGNPCKVLRKITPDDKKKYPIFV